MVSVDAPDQITLTRAEYETLRAGTPATVTIDAAEYQALKANQTKGIDPVVHQRVLARLGEVEQQLRREMQEHNLEIAQMTKRLEHK